MGYVNQSFGYDQKKARKKGKLYSTIDFEVSENISEKYFESNDAPVVGKLHIGGKRFDVTYQELDQIARTMNNAKDVVNRKYKMGLMH
tara:strand:+ start:395 stop:658 length:264 start_codon:yes stop_codon:yes gene_type:complete